MNFPNPVASCQFPVLSSQFSEKPILCPRKLRTGNWRLATAVLRCRALLGRVPQAAALDEAVEIFGKVRGMVPGTLQGLRHEENLKA